MGITVVSCIRIEFEERRVSLLREPGKHDCIVDAMMEELNPIRTPEEKRFFKTIKFKLG
jgi:hypothetical protein